MLELSQAKYFLYRDHHTHKVYKSKDFYELMSRLEFKILVKSSIWAVIPTEQGDQLFEMDLSYDGEPLIFGRFMHIDSFIGFYGNFTDID